MIWPLPQLADVWKVARADRLFPAPNPTAALVGRMAASPDPDVHDLPRVVHGKLAEGALLIAVTQLGCGEAGGNNRGPDVARYIAPAKVPANWCAGFAGWCYEQSARCMGIGLPFKRSLGAKRLGKNVGAVGRVFTDPTLARPGDLMVFHRGAQGSWMGHVALVAGYRSDLFPPGVTVEWIDTVEGNAGPKVMRKVRSVERDRFAFFASLRR